ncbi:MAG: class II aldolase/adducin family protein [Thermodesulfovibrionales bacterium]
MKRIKGTKIPLSILKEFQKFGSLLWQRGLISYQAGNISILRSNSIIIKKRGASLGFLEKKDLVIAPLKGEMTEASSELPTHQAIYKKTDARAIIHSHPSHAVILSLILDEINPLDTEAPILIGNKIPVIKGSPEEIAEVLKDHKIVIVKGHGSFAKGKSLEEAFSITTTLEHSCYVLWGKVVVSSSHLR